MNDDVTIIPAILPKHYRELEESLSRLRGAASLVQIDVCDGRFVPSVSFPCGESDKEKWKVIVREEDGLPFWEEFNFEVDLMAERPIELAHEWVQAGASRIIFHHGSAPDLLPFMSEVSPFAEVGVAFLSNIQRDDIRQYLDLVSFVQVMGIKKIGFQGEPFDDSVLSLMTEIKNMSGTMPIQVDGGVSPETASRLRAAGASRLISGSFILSAVSPKEAIEELKTAAGSA